MSILGRLEQDDLMKALKQQYILTLPSVFGNPGNAIVMYELYERNLETVVNAAYPKFKEQFPEYEHEKGWLWIIYKSLCHQDIDETEAFLKRIV